MAVVDAPLIALINDAGLVEQARTGNRQAFDELYRRHSEAAWRLAYAVTHNAADAAEASAEAFAKIFAAFDRGGYTATGPFRPYLMATTRNAAIDAIRAHGREVPTDELLDLRQPDVPSESVTAAADAGFVRDAFNQLPERHRTVLWLTEVEGMKPREIADVMGLSPNATAQLAVRARASLREHWVQAHISEAENAACRRVSARLGAYQARTMSPRDIAKIDQHLAGCQACNDRLSELEEVHSRLRLLALPLPAGLAAAAADRWSKAVAAASVHAASGVTPLAQRMLAGATALLIGAGIMGATFWGRSEGHDPIPGLASPNNRVNVGADPDDVPFSLTDTIHTPVRPTIFGTESSPTVETPAVVPDGQLSDPTVPDATPIDNGGVKPPSAPEVPVSGPTSTVQANVGAGLGGDNGVQVSVGTDCTGANIGGTTVGCAGDPPEQPGVQVEASTPVPGLEGVGVGLP